EVGMACLGIHDPDRDDNSPEANRRKAVRITAKLSALTCAFHRIRRGLAPVERPNERSFAASFFVLLNGRKPDKVEEEAIDKALILHADHELNASTFSARVTASTLSDLHSALVSAIATLKGPLHGGANRAVMETLQKIGSPDRVAPWVKRGLAGGGEGAVGGKEKVGGWGHGV